MWGQGQVCVHRVNGKEQKERGFLEESHLLKPSRTVILLDFISVPGEVSWCLVGCDASNSQSALLSELGKKTRLDSIHQTSGEMHLRWNSSSFFFYTADCLLKTISVDLSGVLFVPACLPALWCQNCEMWYFRMCLCLVYVKGQWWRDDSTTTQYHHIVPPNRAAAWGRIHCQPGGLERPRKEPACYCNHYHTYASHSFKLHLCIWQTFIPSILQCIQVLRLVYVCSLGIKFMTLALLAPCCTSRSIGTPTPRCFILR